MKLEPKPGLQPPDRKAEVEMGVTDHCSSGQEGRGELSAISSSAEQPEDLLAKAIGRRVAVHVETDTRHDVSQRLAHARRQAAERARQVRSEQAKIPRGRVAEFGLLSDLSDWVPSKRLRTKQKKLIGDEASEIRELRQSGREKVARWRTIWVWIHWIRYLCAEPLSMLWKAVRRFFGLL